ncbi:MAG: MBL fold metallo-hydrolase, partial [Thermoguttaceae bacterium]
VLHTPGHSPGSVSLWIASQRVLISGDAVISPGDLPIYDDYRLCLASIEQLASLDGVEILLSSWDEPKHAEAVGQRFQQARDYLRQIDDAVQQVASSQPQLDPMDVCSQVASKLGLPPAAVNPLVARSLMSHLQRP